MVQKNAYHCPETELSQLGYKEIEQTNTTSHWWYWSVLLIGTVGVVDIGAE